ncbi:hypothetical protein [Hyalangium rubrum]|uniref:Lipoprotein n=1 Tax=Hyalangium rubrum TaxID=3103134 RepID=A0ABU5GWV8_9BACT|nr:hypothetical protein [Hyalangium sp. s54d21]MDY7225678.1 hypothetical protein [Hyalangium sp. s54d21]
MAPRRGLILMLALAMGGCERYPEDPIFAYGEVQRADGLPLSGVTLPVERTVEPLNPRRNRPPPPFQPYTEVTPGADGHFTVEVLSGDSGYFIQGTEQFKARFRMSTPMEEGRAAFLSFEPSDDVELPVLRTWAAGLSRVESPDGAALAFSVMPAAPQLPPSGRVLELYNPDGTVTDLLSPEPVPIVQLLSGGQLIWQRKGAASPWAPTPWMLEDFTAPEMQVRAVSAGIWNFEPLGGFSGGLEFRVEWRSERLPWTAGALRPLSRGAACWPPTEGACPWTDGQLTSTLLRREDAEESVEEVGVTLEAPARVSRVVIRGLGIPPTSDFESVDLVVIEGSEDGEQWMRLGSAAPFLDEGADARSFVFPIEQWAVDSPFDAPLRTDERFLFLDVPLVDAPPVRHVRVAVRPASGRLVALESLAELSLY